MSKYRKIIYPALAIFLIILDQLTKYIIRHSGGFYICNRGVAFGINISLLTIYLFVLLVLFSLVLIISKSKAQISNQAQKLKSKNFVIGIWDLIWNLDFGIWIYLIVAGGISNLIDRIYFSCVTDFIDLHFWPVFNVADICITIGGIIAIVGILRKSK